MLEAHPEQTRKLEESALKGITQGVLYNKNMDAKQRRTLKWTLAEQMLLARAHQMPMYDGTLKQDANAYIRERVRTFGTTPEHEWQQASRRFQERYPEDFGLESAIGACRRYFANPTNESIFTTKREKEHRQQQLELTQTENQIMLAVHELNAMTNEEKAILLCQVFYHYSDRRLSNQHDFRNVDQRYRVMYPKDPAFTTILHTAAKHLTDRQVQKLEKFNPHLFPTFLKQVLAPADTKRDNENTRRNQSHTHAVRSPTTGMLALAALLSAVGIGGGSYAHFRYRRIKNRNHRRPRQTITRKRPNNHDKI